MKYRDTWDLDRIYPGGTTSKELQTKLKDVKIGIQAYTEMVQKWSERNAEPDVSLISILKKQEDVQLGLSQTGTFVQMCHDAYTKDEHANVVMGQVIDLASEMENVSIIFTKKLVAVPDEDWHKILQNSELQAVKFRLNEIRDQGKRLLSEDVESIITELNKDGITAWNSLYGTIVSIMTIPFVDKDGKTIHYSIGQAMNRMYADPDPLVRKKLFESWEEEWTKFSPVFAENLNHLAGYRLTLQKAHGRKSFMEEPLEYNRMTEDTLNAMWAAVEQHKDIFVKFLNQKAKIFGVSQLAWQDVEAPVTFGENEPPRFTYDEACDFIIENFATFGPKLTDFTKHALENSWIEAEDRANKRPGGYCTSLPEWKESRIFMTFTGSPSDTSTLAHELGHAFHSHVMRNLPTLNQDYAMNVAETASTFAETIINNATVAAAKSTEEKVALLNTKLENAVAMFLNIHARFIFEKSFYKERSEGIVSEQRLNELMTSAQKEAYGDSLSAYHPHFWCSKLHFFIDDVPFYNFPYTFGFLFSLGIYAEFLKNPEGFEDKYIALLCDTGSMKVEELAQKHLNVDITKTQFWGAGVELMTRDVEEFIALSDELLN